MFGLEPITTKVQFLKEYHVEIEQAGGYVNTALITFCREEAEEYYEKALVWRAQHGLKGGVRLVAYRGDALEETIRTCNRSEGAILITSNRDWYETDDGEPSRVSPRNH